MSRPEPRRRRQKTASGNEAGFTLVEMLVALGLFALVGLAGVALLRTSVAAQGRVAERLDDAARWARAHAIITRDLGHALPRPALEGGAEALSLRVADGAETAAPQRVRYATAGDALLVRQVEGVGAEAARLLPGAGTLRLRYRARDGGWHDLWPPVGAPAEPEAMLPTAIEWTLTPAGRPPVVMVVLPGPAPEPAPEPAR